MTISSSLNAGVAGLATNASRLASISDNIANSSTIGYKRVETHFSSLVTESGTGSYTAGGVNVATTRIIDQPGALRTTGNETDLAVRGRGFLPVTQVSALAVETTDFPLQLSTTGSFRTDKDGFLVTDSGLVLMGIAANVDGTIPNFARDTKNDLEPVQVNLNQTTGEATTQLSLGVNLPATETEVGASGDPYPLPIEYFDNLGRSQTLDIVFTPLLPVAPATDPTNQWTMSITDGATGTLEGEYTITFDDSRDNGGSIDTVVRTSATGVDYDPNTGLIQISVGGDPANVVTIDLGARQTGNGLTQYSDSFAPTNISKDGSPVGNLTSVEVDRNGFVTSNFDNGITRVEYQIPLIDLANPNGLISQDAQTYTTSLESGSIFLWDAGDGATGDIISFALEESATDVAGELTSLIQTQRAYSSNAKVIQTVDEMLQETTNIKR